MKKSKKQKVLAVLLAAALAASALPMTAVTAFASDDEEPLVVCTESFMNESPHFVSDDIYVYAWAYGGNSGDGDSDGYVYRFDYRSADADEWTVIAEYSSEQSVSFQIDTAGSYVLRLSAMDLDGVVAYEDIDLNIYAIPINTSTISAASITNYEPITITPSFDGDMEDNDISGYVVSWKYLGTDQNDADWIFISSDEPTEINPAYTGTYEITVDLELYYGETETAVFNVDVYDTLNFQSLYTENEYATFTSGDDVHLYADVTGGYVADNEDYTYSYAWRYTDDDDEDAWSALDIPSSGDPVFTADWTQDVEIMGTVTDSAGHTASNSIYLSYVEPLTVTAVTDATAVSECEAVIPVTVTVSGGSNESYDCKFFCTADGDENEVELDSEIADGDIYSMEQIVYLPTDPGTYHLTACVSDWMTGQEITVDVGDITVYSEFSINPEAPYETVVGRPVVIDSNAEGGYGSYSISYYYDYSNDDTEEYENGILAENVAATTLTHTFTKPGRYIISVEGTDQLENYAGGEVELYVNNTLQSEFSISEDTIYLGDSVDLCATTSGGMGDVRYAFYYKPTSSTKWTALDSFGDDICTFEPTATGTYDICIKATDDTNTTVKQYFTVKVYSQINATLLPDLPTFAKYFGSGALPIDNNLTFELDIQGGTAPLKITYFYDYFSNGGVERTVVAEQTDKTKVTFSLAKEGTYMFHAVITDQDGQETEALYEFCTAKPASLSSDTIMLGEYVTVNAQCFNEAQITQFAYYYRKSGSTKWITADDYSENSSIDITPIQAGTYEVCVKLKDENNSVTKAYLTFTAEESEPLYVVLEATDQSVFTGNTVTFYADAAGGAYGEFTYAFYYKKTDSTKWLTLAGFGYDNSVSFTPAEAGTYDICVKAKDALGNVAKNYVTITAEDFKPFTINMDDTITLGQTVTVSAVSNLPTERFQYAFYYKKSDTTKWLTAAGFSYDSSVSITPTSAGSYDICVKSKNSNGAVEKAYASLSVEEVKPLTLSAELNDTAIIPGDAVSVRAIAAGGVPGYTYAFYCKQPGSSKWITLSDFSANSSARILGEKEGIYEVCVKVKDAKKTIAKTYTSFTVSETLPLTLKASLSNTSITLGDTAAIFANAKGGSGDYEYAYYCKEPGSSKWSTLSGFSGVSSFSITPNAKGAYEICVKAKDSTTTVKSYLTLTVE